MKKIQYFFSKSYTPNVEIKDFNVLIDGKTFIETPIKIKKKHTETSLKWEEIMTTPQVTS